MDHPSCLPAGSWRAHKQRVHLTSVNRTNTKPESSFSKPTRSASIRVFGGFGASISFQRAMSLKGELGDGSVIGQKGIKYGLQLPSGAKKPLGKAASAKAAPTRPNVFGADSDSDDDVGGQISRQADKKRAAAKVWPAKHAAWRFGTCADPGWLHATSLRLHA